MKTLTNILLLLFLLFLAVTLSGCLFKNEELTYSVESDFPANVRMAIDAAFTDFGKQLNVPVRLVQDRQEAKVSVYLSGFRASAQDLAYCPNHHNLIACTQVLRYEETVDLETGEKVTYLDKARILLDTSMLADDMTT